MRTISDPRAARSALGALCLAGAALLAVNANAAAQGAISGRISDARSGLPLGGATVQIEALRLGAVAAADGRYRIANVPAGTHQVSVQNLGYAPMRRNVTVSGSGQETADFALEVQAITLDQVVVTSAASGERLRELGNSVARIDAAQAVAISAPPTLSTLINARAPGVTINFTTGRLGAGQSINIRGRSSLTLGNSPLIYVDGVRVNSEVGSGTGPSQVSGALSSQGAGVAGRLNDIDPEDIESIEVIKGPAAATIYGTEASSGVIQIITKKGVRGARPVFTFQVQQGSIYFRDAAGRLPTNYLPDPANPTNIVKWNAVQAEDSLPLFRTGRMTGLQGSVSGGFDQARYYISSSFDDSDGVEPNNALKQFSLHANVDVTPNSKLDVSSSLHFVDVRARLGTDAGASILYGANYGHALFPGISAARGFAPGIAPEFIWALWDNSQKVRRFTTSNTIVHRPTSWFSQRLNVGLDFTSDDARNLERFATPALQAVAPAISGVAATGRISQFLRNSTIFSVDYSGSARADLTSSISAATSIGLQTFRTEGAVSTLGGTGFAGPGVETLAATATALPASSTTSLNTTVGAYAQEKLSLRDRLFLTGALRVDNNSAFGEDFKWVTYPKADLAWVVSEEPFWRWSNVINTLRLRTAFGESGRAPNTFSALRTFTPVQGPGGSNAVTPGSLGNPDLRPEVGKELEVGFEAEVLRRLSLDFTYYNKRTVDLIVNQTVAPSSGFPGSVPRNLGRVDNSGIELRAVLQAVDRQNLRWELSGTLATTNDKIKDLGGLPSTISSAGNSNQLGYPVQGIWSRKIFSADRNPTTHAITNVLCDSAGVGVPCARGQFYFIGPSLPSKTGAITSTITALKRVRLFAMVDFQRGNFVFNGNEAVRCSGLLGRPLCHANYYPESYSTKYLASLTTASISQNYFAEFIQNASYVKLREVSLSYQLPQRFLAGASDASITISARELATWTKYKGLDPDFSNLTDQATLPQLSRLTAILNVRF